MTEPTLRRKSVVALIACVFALCSGMVGAEGDQTLDEPELLEAVVPELNDPSPQTKSSATGMSCLVDTPSYDQWGSPTCISVGNSVYATAFFRIDNPPSNSTIFWSDSRCDSSATTCSVPIRMYTTITMDATVLDHSDNTFDQVSATAWYEGLF